MEEIEQIVNNDSLDNHQKISDLFELDTMMYVDLGKDSTTAERKEVKKNSKAIYNAIKKINPEIGISLTTTIDKL